MIVEKWIGGFLGAVVSLVLLVPLVWGGMMLVHSVSMGQGGMMSSMMSRSDHHSRMKHRMGGMMGTMHNREQASKSGQSVATRDSDSGTDQKPSEPDLTGQVEEFSLKTSYSNGMSFVGETGPIEGTVNPQLEVTVGDTVRIRLVNTAGGRHDWLSPELNVGTEMLRAQGQSTMIQFVATKPGKWAYICSVPGHRSAGMEGTIVVRPADTAKKKAKQ